MLQIDAIDIVTMQGLMTTGLRADDPRLVEMYENVEKVKARTNKVNDDTLIVDYHTFMGIISENLEIVVKAFSNSFIIPDFKTFCDKIDELYNMCRFNDNGEVGGFFWSVEKVTFKL